MLNRHASLASDRSPVLQTVENGFKIPQILMSVVLKKQLFNEHFIYINKAGHYKRYC